jgi:hypothetical protein
MSCLDLSQFEVMISVHYPLYHPILPMPQASIIPVAIVILLPTQSSHLILFPELLLSEFLLSNRATVNERLCNQFTVCNGVCISPHMAPICHVHVHV